MNKKTLVAALIILVIAGGVGFYLYNKNKNEAFYASKIASCQSVPNNSTKNIKEKEPFFLNLPQEIYPVRENDLEFSTVSGDAKESFISNVGITVGADVPECRSYYYQFNGKGEVELTVKSGMGGMPDYNVRFIVGDTQ